MKKLIALLAAMTFFAGAVSCGKGKKSSSDTVVIPDGNVQDDSQDKIHIKLFTTTTFHHNDNDPINTFIRESGKYVLDETEFFYEDDPYGTQALTDMNIEILSGNSPDIIVTQSHNMEKLRKKGYLADLTPLMESYDGTKPDDFLSNVRESITHDGKIDYIYPYYYFQTAYAKSSHFDRDMTNWTYKDAIETYKNLPDGMQFIWWIPSDELLWNYMLTMVASTLSTLRTIPVTSMVHSVRHYSFWPVFLHGISLMTIETMPSYLTYPSSAEWFIHMDLTVHLLPPSMILKALTQHSWATPPLMAAEP